MNPDPTGHTFHLQSVARSPESYEVRDEQQACWGIVRAQNNDPEPRWYCRRTTGDVSPSVEHNLEAAVKFVIGDAEWDRNPVV